MINKDPPPTSTALSEHGEESEGDEDDGDEEDNEEEDEEDLRERWGRGTFKRDGWPKDMMVDSSQSNTVLASRSGRS